MALPANVDTCQIVGRFMRAVVDGTDPDTDPDGIPVEGLRVEFTASVPVVRNVAAAVTIFLDKITCTTDADGVLVSDGQPGVFLVASDDPDLDPRGWTYKVTLSAPSISQLSFSFVAPAGGVLDLTTVVPVPQNPGQTLDAWLQAVADARAAADAAADSAAEAQSAAGSVGGDIGQAVADYLTEHPLEGATTQYVDGAVADHVESETPHPVYDNIPSLTLLFENGLA